MLRDYCGKTPNYIMITTKPPKIKLSQIYDTAVHATLLISYNAPKTRMVVAKEKTAFNSWKFKHYYKLISTTSKNFVVCCSSIVKFAR